MATPNMYTPPQRNSVPLVSVISSENEIYHINSRGYAVSTNALCLVINSCEEYLHG